MRKIYNINIIINIVVYNKNIINTVKLIYKNNKNLNK